MKYLLAVLLSLAFIVPIANATVIPEPDECGESHVYTYSNDSSSSPANVDFINTGATGNPDSITVSADVGFVITKVELSIDDDGESGFYTYATGPVTNYNPNGTTINVAKVTVMKVCASPPPVCPIGTTGVWPVCIPIPPVDLCPFVTGVQTSLPCASSLCEPPASWNSESQICIAPPPVDVCPLVNGNQTEGTCVSECEQGSWNPESQTCVEVPPAPTPVLPTPIQGGNGMIYCSGPLAPGWHVDLPGGGCGIVSVPTPAPQCGPLLSAYIRKGWIGNNPGQVTLLQNFLNGNLGTTLSLNGVFSAEVESTVKTFQVKYMFEVLSPWNLLLPTGIVWKTTQNKINKLWCDSLKLDMPVLIPWNI